MPPCAALDGCPFFQDKMVNMPAVATLVKQHYCLNEHEHTQCARYLVRSALGAARVPSDLFPDQIVRAREMISRG